MKMHYNTKLQATIQGEKITWKLNPLYHTSLQILNDYLQRARTEKRQR
jgi:hypothetical protein